MKRLMLVWVMILSLVPLGAICDTQVALDEEAAREYAIRVLSRPEIGCMDAESMHMDLLRDGDCWICYATSVDNGDGRFTLVFDDNRYIHRFQDSHFELPDVLYKDYEYPLSEEDDDFLQDAHAVAGSWLATTRGWDFESFVLDQMIDEDTWLFSIDELSSYIVISRINGTCVIRAYGMMTGSHGTYGDGVAKTQAVELAYQAVDPHHRLEVLFVSFWTGDVFTTEDGVEAAKPCWHVILRSRGVMDDAYPGTGYMVKIDAISGDITDNLFLGHGTGPIE